MGIVADNSVRMLLSCRRRKHLCARDNFKPVRDQGAAASTLSKQTTPRLVFFFFLFLRVRVLLTRCFMVAIDPADSHVLVPAVHFSQNIMHHAWITDSRNGGGTEVKLNKVGSPQD